MLSLALTARLRLCLKLHKLTGCHHMSGSVPVVPVASTQQLCLRQPQCADLDMNGIPRRQRHVKEDTMIRRDVCISVSDCSV